MTIDPVIGSIPSDTTVFKVQKRVPKAEGGGETWQSQLAAADGGEDANVSTFPIAALSLENVRQAFGAGTYRVQFFGDNGNGGIKLRKNSGAFEVNPERVAPSAPGRPRMASPSAASSPPAAPASAVPPGFETLLALENIINRRYEGLFKTAQADADARVAAANANAVAQVTMQANFFAAIEKARGDGNGGKLATALERVLERLDGIEERLDEEDDDDQAEATAAAANAPPMGGIMTADGSISAPHTFQKLIEEGLPLLKALIENNHKKPAAVEGGAS